MLGEWVLKAKYKFIIAPKKLKSYSNGQIEWAQKEVYQKALTVLKNEKELLPIKYLNKKIAHTQSIIDMIVGKNPDFIFDNVPKSYCKDKKKNVLPIKRKHIPIKENFISFY